MARPQDVPLMRHKVETVLARSGLKRDSYSGKSLRHILETLPREELFQSTEDELFATAMGILELATEGAAYDPDGHRKEFVENLKRFLEGEPLKEVVDRQAGY